jgi:hypothetical protein
MDPRVQTPREGLQQQFALSKELYDGALAAQAALDQLRAIREQVRDRQGRVPQGTLADALKAFDASAEALEGTGGGGAESLNALIRGFGSPLGRLQAADVAPADRLVQAVESQRENAARVAARWSALRDEELPRLNALLGQGNLPVIQVR